jgi:hypothetical protein
MSDATSATATAIELRQIHARVAPAERRGVYVHCPDTEGPREIGECLFCKHYRGLWFGTPGQCSLQCDFRAESGC